jgi:hypothetical protein
MPSTTILYARLGRLGRMLYHTDGDQLCSQLPVFRPKGSHPSRGSRCGTQSWRRGNTHGSCRISVSVFVCARAFAEDLSSETHRAPAPHVITLLHGATSLMGPPLLTEEQKQIRVQLAIELFQVLSVQSTHQWHDIVTLDESWICLFSEHDLMWTAPGEIVVDRERYTVQSPKFMLTVIWNPFGLYVLKTLPKRRKFNAQYYTIIQMISRSQSQIGGGKPG